MDTSSRRSFHKSLLSNLSWFSCVLLFLSFSVLSVTLWLGSVFHAGERAGAGAEPVGFDAQAVEHREVEVAQRRRVVGVEGQMLAVLEASAGEEDRQVFGVVVAGVAEVAAEEDHGPVEQALALLPRRPELLQEIP